MFRKSIALLAFVMVSGLPGWVIAQPSTTKQSAHRIDNKAQTRSTSNLPRQRGDSVFRANKQELERVTRTPKKGVEAAKSDDQLGKTQPASSGSSRAPTQLPTFQRSAQPSAGPPLPPIVPVEPKSQPSGFRFQDDATRDSLAENGKGVGSGLEDKDDDQADQQSDAEEEVEEEPTQEETFFRPEIHEAGPLTWESYYTGEVFNNTHGGIGTSHATRYRGNLDLTFLLDFEKASLWSGGEIFVYFHQSHGTTLTPDFVGDGQYYSNIDTGPRPQQLSRLGEYWFRQTSLDENAAVKIGQQDANADFAFCDLGGDFLNSSFVTIPNIPMPFWPFQSLGVSGIIQVDEQMKFGGGVYDQSHNQEQWWTTPVDQGIFTIWQADWSPFAAIEDSMLTLIRLGGWYSSADTLAIGRLNYFPENYGFYTTMDRMLITERGAEDQGLGGFFQFSWAPADRNQVDRAYAAGLVYRGLLEQRDHDTCGIAYTGILFGDRQETETGQTSEDVMELFYKARLRRGVSVQPDLQYIARPNGQERDALVVGIRCECNF